jgi:hypothetical protein
MLRFVICITRYFFGCSAICARNSKLSAHGADRACLAACVLPSSACNSRSAQHPEESVSAHRRWQRVPRPTGDASSSADPRQSPIKPTDNYLVETVNGLIPRRARERTLWFESLDGGGEIELGKCDFNESRSHQSGSLIVALLEVAGGGSSANSL